MKETLVVLPLAGYAPEVGAALWQLEDARHRTLRLLNDLPPDYVDAETGGNTVGTILYHVALIEADWLYAEILEEPVPKEVMALLPADHRNEEGVLTFVRGQTLAQHLERLQAIRNQLLKRLRTLTAEDLHRPRQLASYDVSPAWVLHHLAQHEAEHRGELGAMLTALRAASG
jgi:uncharacterized damage-inducible protein DinB